MRALQLRDVDVQNRIYFSGVSPGQSPVIFQGYYTGFVGWIGDSNAADGSTDVLLQMCGI
jgi:hypothetical protein